MSYLFDFSGRLKARVGGVVGSTSAAVTYSRVDLEWSGKLVRINQIVTASCCGHHVERIG